MAMIGQYSLIITIFLVVCKPTSGNNETKDPLKYALLQYLLDPNRYDPSIPPDYFYDNATDVYVQIAIYDLSSESEQNMEYDCTMYLRMNWTDKRLDYSANASYDVLKVSGSYVSKVWIPDIFFHDDRSETFLGFIGKNELVFIGRNGNMQFSGRISMKSTCTMDLGRYPYDRPRCPITIQSYAYTADDVILHWSKNNPVITPPKFLIELQNERTESFTSPYSDAVGNFSTLQTTVQLERDDGSFFELYIFPPIILVLTAWSSFFFGDAFKNITPRIAVCAAALTTIIMHWAGLYNKLRPGSGLKKLDKWMLMNLIFIFITICANCAAYHFECELKFKCCKCMNNQTKDTQGLQSQTKGQNSESEKTPESTEITRLLQGKDISKVEEKTCQCFSGRIFCSCASNMFHMCQGPYKQKVDFVYKELSSAAKMAIKREAVTTEQKEIVISLENDGHYQRKIAQTLGISQAGRGVNRKISLNKILCVMVIIAYFIAVWVYVPSWYR